MSKKKTETNEELAKGFKKYMDEKAKRRKPVNPLPKKESSGDEDFDKAIQEFLKRKRK